MSGGGCRDVLDVLSSAGGVSGNRGGWRGVGFAGAFAEEGAALVGVVASRRAFGRRATLVGRGGGEVGGGVAGPRAWWHWLLRGFAGVVGLSCCCIAVRAKREGDRRLVLVARAAASGWRGARGGQLPGWRGFGRTTPAVQPREIHGEGGGQPGPYQF